MDMVASDQRDDLQKLAVYDDFRKRGTCIQVFFLDLDQKFTDSAADSVWMQQGQIRIMSPSRRI